MNMPNILVDKDKARHGQQQAGAGTVSEPGAELEKIITPSQTKS